jgi:hypothetical protein
MRSLAGRIIAHETKAISPDSNQTALFHVCDRLRPHLAMLMGNGGFRAVLARALAVSSAEVPWLVAVQVGTDGTFEGWDRPEAEVDAEEMTEGSVLLIAHLLGLLVAFIGDNLTLRLVRDVWPTLSLEDLNFTKGDHP